MTFSRMSLYSSLPMIPSTRNNGPPPQHENNPAPCTNSRHLLRWATGIEHRISCLTNRIPSLPIIMYLDSYSRVPSTTAAKSSGDGPSPTGDSPLFFFEMSDFLTGRVPKSLTARKLHLTIVDEIYKSGNPDIKLTIKKNNLDGVVLLQFFVDLRAREPWPVLADPRDDAVEARDGLTRS